MPEFFGRRNYLILFGLIFISMLILTIHFREGQDGPIHRAQRLVLAATAPLQAAVTTALTPVRDGWDYLAHFGELKRENRELKKEVSALKSELFARHGLEAENDRLRKLIDFKQKQTYDTVAANVIGMPENNWWSSIIVDKGLSSGVKHNMPVIAGGGLVGQVSDSSSEVSKVVLLNDVQSGVSVQVQRSGEVGVIKGQLKDKRLTLQYISRDSDIKNGDIIVTSGLGGIFPKDLYIGKVVTVRQSVYSLYKTVEVEPPVDFSNIEEVLILKYDPGVSITEGN